MQTTPTASEAVAPDSDPASAARQTAAQCTSPAAPVTPADTAAQSHAAQSHDGGQTTPTRTAQEWVRVLARYREPDPARSAFELSISVLPFIGIWALALWALSFSYVLAFVLGVANAAFVLRLFLIQHDCGHGAFFADKRIGDWVGRVLAVFTMTPYDVWKRTHSAHHSATGNLDKRGLGDVHTMTVAEYRAATPFQRLMYRLYRHPVVLFGLGPGFLFLLQNRIPYGLMSSGWIYWISAMGTNLATLGFLVALYVYAGWAPILLIFLPSVMVAATIGMWLFYIQHQFEDTYWEGDSDWQIHDAALHGSSHYDLPPLARWFTANIGIHHVHHLYARIPYYKLPQVLRDHTELAQAQRLGFRESLSCVKFHLWDENARRLISFKAERELAR
ncbi:MAG: fatty acid desaturase [Rhodobacterales bacterium]